MGSPKRRPADEPPATIDEIIEALGRLTTGDLLRIRKYCYLRYWTLGRRGAGRNPEDLFSEAVIRLLEGKRKWQKSRVDIVELVIGVIKSISSHISEALPDDAFDDVVAYTAPDEEGDALDRRPARAALTPEEELEARDLERDAEELDGRIREHFKGDEHALMVYEGLCENMKPAEIRDCGLTAKEFDAARKRFERGMNKIVPGGQR